MLYISTIRRLLNNKSSSLKALQPEELLRLGHSGKSCSALIIHQDACGLFKIKFLPSYFVRFNVQESDVIYGVFTS